MARQPIGTVSSRSEANFLQPLFDSWRKRSIEVAGAPAWLAQDEVDNVAAPERTFDALGYRFEIDVLWRTKTERRVIELKNAWKYEPLALAEVLHHAHLLRMLERDTPPVRPAIVARYSGWTRAALAELTDNGLRRDHLDYLEFDHLRAGNQEYLWLDSPLASWEEREPDLPVEARGGWQYWHFVPHTNLWVATRERLKSPRPLFISGLHRMVAPVLGRPGHFLIWEGQGPTLESSRHDWADKYELVHP